MPCRNKTYRTAKASKPCVGPNHPVSQLNMWNFLVRVRLLDSPVCAKIIAVAMTGRELLLNSVKLGLAYWSTLWDRECGQNAVLRQRVQQMLGVPGNARQGDRC